LLRTKDATSQHSATMGSDKAVLPGTVPNAVRSTGTVVLLYHMRLPVGPLTTPQADGKFHAYALATKVLCCSYCMCSRAIVAILPMQVVMVQVR
jgi:hypothetical protein